MHVCKRWRDIYEQRIWFQAFCPNGRIGISLQHWEGPNHFREQQRLKTILFLLQKYPQIRQSLTIFSFAASTQSNSSITSLISAILPLCNSIKEVYLNCDFDEHARDLLPIRSPFLCFEEMSLNISWNLSLRNSGSQRRRIYESGRAIWVHEQAYISGPSLWAIVHFVPSSVTTLRLSGYGLGVQFEAHARTWGVVTEAELNSALPPALYRTGQVQKLVLTDPNCPPEVSERLMLWPAALVDISIKDEGGYELEQHFTVQGVQRILDVQRCSLKRIHIHRIVNSFRHDARQSPDFSHYPCLEHLRISGQNIVGKEAPQDAARKLSAPQLRSVTFVFQPYPRRYRSTDFRQEEARWCQEFARLKAELYPNSKLEEISIVFDLPESELDPEAECIRKQSRRAEGRPVLPDEDYTIWPWLFIKQASAAVRMYNLKIKFNPGMAEAEWNRLVSQFHTRFGV